MSEQLFINIEHNFATFWIFIFTLVLTIEFTTYLTIWLTYLIKWKRKQKWQTH